MPGLGASFGRGAATTNLQDLANSDCILIMGSNMAEAHPVGFRWPMKAKERGAALIHVDPRFSRTSALCDLHVQIRAGSDIVFMGALINYVLSTDSWFREYVLAYTNASSIVKSGYVDAEDNDGVFSGYDPERQSYNAEDGQWTYGASRDETLQDPRCVFQILKRHYVRYTPALVEELCGCSRQEFLRVADLLVSNSGRERTSAICYAVGWTQHTTGVQIIRAAAILQSLLGNMGRPGGGIMALRGHASIQGSTDVSTLYDSLPGYLPQPLADPAHDTLDGYCANVGLRTGYWANFKKFAVSLMKAWYGDGATPQNDWGWAWVPRIDGDYSQLPFFDLMRQGRVKGYFLYGQNPAGGGPNAGLHRAGLRQLDWLVVLDWFFHESSVFWKDDPKGPAPQDVKTEVFFLPAAASPEKEGTFTNTHRLLQWHDKAIDPPDDCRSDAWYTYQLGKRLKRMYAQSTLDRDQGLRHLTWDYDKAEPDVLPDGSRGRIEGEPDMNVILQEINGCDLTQIDARSGRPRLLAGFSELQDNGSTACGCWIYSGVYPDPERNRARAREIVDGPVQLEWGFAWPQNRRLMYNRASAAPDGTPWSARKQYLWWDAESQRWSGFDVPDFEPTKPPDYRPAPNAEGMAAIGGTDPFIMKPDGRAWLYAPAGTKDGPLPTHYEPVESPVHSPLYRQQTNPTARVFESDLNRLAVAGDPNYPIVGCTFRLTEHYLSGPMSRFNSWLNELQPEMFVEMSPQLARERGIENGAWCVVTSARGAIEARALVTHRLRPMVVEGRTLHQIGLPFHWGYAGETVGAIANDLTSLVADPNVTMHEGKVFACDVQAGRLHLSTLPTESFAPWPNREIVPRTPPWAQPEGHLK